MMWKAALIVAFYLATGNANECVPLKVDDNIIACVCNATYCDSIPAYDAETLEQGISYWYVTNKHGLRMSVSQQKFGTCQSSPSNVTLTIDSTKRYQTIIGFGGAFTDSAGMNINSLSPKARDQLIRAYYDPIVGSRYTLARIPIGCSDFSPRPYTYDDVDNDVTLKHFSLAQEDYKYKIPNIKKALKLNPELKVISAAWSAPGWMKTNGQLSGFGYLKGEYYQTYANYLAKFVDEYKKNGIDIWAISTGNEPNIAFQINATVITMGWKPKTMALWVGLYLGPTLAASGHKDTHILALDDDIFVLPGFVRPILSYKYSRNYTIGTAVHWYFDYKVPITVLDEVYDEFPDKFLLMTEASIGPPAWGSPDMVSKSWNYGEKYILKIIEYLNHWVGGWVDWNLALNEEGGPISTPIKLSAAVIVNSDKDEFYKLPMYYAIAHFSRFVDKGSIKISITDTDTIKSTAFVTPSNEVVVVLYNSGNSTQHITLKDTKKDGTLSLELSPYSMNTLVYKH